MRTPKKRERERKRVKEKKEWEKGQEKNLMLVVPTYRSAVYNSLNPCRGPANHNPLGYTDQHLDSQNTFLYLFSSYCTQIGRDLGLDVHLFENFSLQISELGTFGIF